MTTQAGNVELPSINDSCTPRQDVLRGGLVDKHFAAQLDQVVRRAPGYEAYSEADAFFALTYPTAGLRDLLAGTFARVSGKASAAPSAEHSVYRYETSFGGGKTHGLIALWHLANGARPPNVTEFIDPALLPDTGVCRAAAFVGDSADPVRGLTTDGVTTWTLWGEIGRQLGPDAYEIVKASDESRTSCGKQTWLDMFGAHPTVIVIDEVAQYLRRLTSSGDGKVQQLGRATIDSLKVLFEAATAAPAVRVIVTLATGTAAFGQETANIQETFDDIESERLVAEAADVMERPKGAVGRPAEDHEIGFILRRRLFEKVDEAAAERAAAAYQQLYATLARRDVKVGAATADPAAYAERLRSAYPFHPALIDCLDKRIGPLPGFQRARGALKMLAEATAKLWAGAGPRDLAIVNLGDLPLEATAVRACITSSIGREQLDGPAVADFAHSRNSHAAGVDRERWPDKRLAMRSCRTVFCHSVAGEPFPGAGPPDIYAGTLRPGDDEDLIDEALIATSQVAWHLVSDGVTWRFQTAPNANRIIATEMANVLNADVTEELDLRIRNIFPSEGPVKAVHGPYGPADVLDTPSLRLAVFNHVDVAVKARDASSPPGAVVRMASRANVSETSRTFRNAVVSLVADSDAIEVIRERVRFELAAQRIAGDPQRLKQFDKEVADSLKKLADKAQLEARVAICNAYRHLYWPAKDPHNHNLKHQELHHRESASVRGPQTSVIVDALKTNGKVRDAAPPTNRLAAATGFGRPNIQEITTKDIFEAPWRDHGQPILLNPTLVSDAIGAGVRNGTWVYFDTATRETGTPDAPPPAVRIADDVMLYTRDRAERLGLLAQKVTLAAVISTVDGERTGRVSGDQLRRQLEDVLGGEPPKQEILEILSRGSATGDVVVVEAARGDDAEPLTRAEVAAARLSDLAVLTRAAAAEQGIVDSADQSADLVARGEGSPGAALQQVTDFIADVGVDCVASVEVTATVDPGEGVADIRTLGYCIPQLPRLGCHVRATLTSEYHGLKGGLRVDLSGAAADYQRLEQRLLDLAGHGRDVTGSLTLLLTPAAPMRHGDRDWQQLRSVLTANNPGHVVIEAKLAHEDPSPEFD